MPSWINARIILTLYEVFKSRTQLPFLPIVTAILFEQKNGNYSKKVSEYFSAYAGNIANFLLNILTF